MNKDVPDNQLKLLKVTIVAALTSGAIITIAAAALQVDALRYLLLAGGAALIASPFLGIPDRIVKYVASKRGSTYVGFFLYFLPITFTLTTFLLGAYLWLGLSSGILEPSDYLIPVISVVAAILINIGVLVYNLVEMNRADDK